MTSDPMRCPSAAVLDLLLAEQLSDPELDPVEAHLEQCADCQDRLDQLIARTIPKAVSAYVSHPLEAVPNGEFLQRLKQMPQPQLSLAGRNWSFEPEYAEALPSTLISAGEKRRLNQYEIIEKLGQGSMGVV